MRCQVYIGIGHTKLTGTSFLVICLWCDQMIMFVYSFANPFILLFVLDRHPIGIKYPDNCFDLLRLIQEESHSRWVDIFEQHIRKAQDRIARGK